MTVGRPRKWSGYYKRIEVRIPKEYSHLVDALETISTISGKSINELVIDSLIDYFDFYNPSNNKQIINDFDIRKNARIMFLKLQIKEAFINYLNEAKILCDKYKSNKFDLTDLYYNYSYLQQYRTNALKLISKLPQVDDEIKEIYMQLIDLPQEVKEICQRIEG